MDPSSVLIVGNHRQTLAVLRSLARAGHETVLGLGPADSRFAARSRSTHKTWSHPPLDDAGDDELLAALTVAIGDCRQSAVLFPVGELEIRRCLALAPRLPAGVTVVVANPAALEACLDKARTAEVFTRLEIPQARTHIVRSVADLERAAAALGFPVVIKSAAAPTDFLPEKALVVPDAESLKRWNFADWPAEVRVLVQSHARGRRHNVYFAAERGRILARLEVRIDRTDRVDDTGLAVEGTTIPPTPSLLDHCDRFVQELAYHGVGCFQFLVDHDPQQIAILEVNPRLGANCAVVIDAGLDLPMLALPLAAGEAPPEVPQSFRFGLRYAWFLGDVDGALHGLARGYVGPFGALSWFVRGLGKALVADTHIIWSWRDPVPSLLLCKDSLANCVHAVIARLFRRRRRSGPAHKSSDKRDVAAKPIADG